MYLSIRTVLFIRSLSFAILSLEALDCTLQYIHILFHSVDDVHDAKDLIIWILFIISLQPADTFSVVMK